ncbi:DUF763 domain-containing protein [Rhizosphaericola mali]|uniref:DUF763 domain-containing protein n=1 Tax=Rhizosphaericola mali TaxID=2545455 RepID=A0A5P2G658_9BACT|nr:DUF763 domain-containing protein [Rhizosphaericola mali]QES89709.1 DUF763 domain-containing protein [Rhizosphaericola mali]
MKSGHADLPLHYGTVPLWLAQRMSSLGGAIVESILLEYGKQSLLEHFSNPFWFQSLGCVLGMDWHSSGITTSVLGALKKYVNPRSNELGIYMCGGRGKASRKTPAELLAIAEKTGLDGNSLVYSSKLAAKVDNNAIQDGFQLYLHSFILSDEGEWTIVQQGMNTESKMARRYHWLSSEVKSFVETPHQFIYGPNQGEILNLTDKNATSTKSSMLELTKERPVDLLQELQLILPKHHEVTAKDVNLKRLGAALALAHETDISSIESLMLLKDVGPRTLQSLALVSEVIHGTPSRFEDPARFSFAHGGKDGHPFPVPIKIYDQTIEHMHTAIEKAKMDDKEKSSALFNLTRVSQELEKGFTPNDRFDDWIEKERAESYKYGGRSVFGKAQPPKNGDQLSLF